MTPISVYQALDGKHKMLFESSAKHEESGRYSFIAVNPIAELIGDKNGYTFTKEQDMEKSSGNVFAKLKQVMHVHEAHYPFAFFRRSNWLFLVTKQRFMQRKSVIICTMI